ncbi:MAG: DUF6259 domain-containing protein [Verrucomicrobiota bacterium]
MKHGRFRVVSRLLPALVLSLACGAAFGADEQLTQFSAGDLQLTVRRSVQGVSVQSLADSKQAQELLAPGPRPLFTLALRQGGSTSEAVLASDQGWCQCVVTQAATRLELRWSEPVDESLAGLSVRAVATADARASALHWKLYVENPSTNQSLWRVVFPQLALAGPGADAAVLFPRGPGEVQRGVWERPFNYHGNYPDSGCTMQFMAAYGGGDNPRGLYLATHDPWGSTKDLVLQSDPATHSLRLSFEHPVPNMGLAGNSFALEGEAVWGLLRGDWFDAAMIYRIWAQREAKWWPPLGRDGRPDTPRWMRELNAWTITGGAPGECVPAVREFRAFLGVPLGFHWYNWHQIPFDNDYPHYFPAKAGFAQGVAELESAGVFPMPYINGRLWDSHDRGTEDFEFSKLALAGVTKHSDGAPCMESYGSKETNGQPVRLGVMCPSSPLWQNTVSNLVWRLVRECKTSGVYIDQVAAAAPKLCMDPAHGHPLGGGHWWTEGYWKMLEGIRNAMPREAILTTECNSEPFVRWFDGYLTWHWQHEGQVPAFPAVYGGAIQMFGRAYRGGATRDLALRMKAGQQLVFGEQLGWLDPGVVKQADNAGFFRQLVQLRSKFSRYFFAGEMTRPPALLGDVPKVKADWQWSGEWWVTTDAVLTGAWRLPAEGRLLLLFVNGSDAPVTASVRPAAEWGLPAGPVSCEMTFGASMPVTTAAGVPEKPATFAPRQAQVWELRW